MLLVKVEGNTRSVKKYSVHSYIVNETGKFSTFYGIKTDVGICAGLLACG